MMRRFLPLIPVTLFLLLALVFVYRLKLIGEGDTPNLIQSVMIGKPAPQFSLPPLMEGEKPVTDALLKGRVTLVSIFASWCVPCRAEHPLLGDIEKAGIPVIGINYKDKPDAARKWIAEEGNPYAAIGEDSDGRVAIDFGVYGVPESYLIDKNGVIRFKQTGPLTPDIIENKLLPLAGELSK